VNSKWAPLWAIVTLVALAIGTVWLRLSIVRTTYAINETNKEIRELNLAKEQMELKVTALRSPRRLENLARTRFNLSQPKSDQVIYFRESDGKD
jgi:cell division protein FtsL